MGCDIHLFVERRVNGVWEPADNWIDETDVEEGEPPRKCVSYESLFYSGRNYDLFSILADVRNGRGFAGIKTGEGFNPICDPKGLPDDVTELVKSSSDYWGSDGHSHSWLTVAELLAYDWTQETTSCGVLSAAEFYEWNRWKRSDGEGPESYCGGVSGRDVQMISEAEMVSRLEPFKNERDESVIQKALPNIYCHCEWKMPYYKSVRHFLSDTMPRLWALGKHDDVRIVFWFDN